jgi:hypothetical protein
MFIWSVPFMAIEMTLFVCGGLFSVLWAAMVNLPPEALLIAIPVLFGLAVFVVVVGALPGHVAAMRVKLTGQMEDAFAFEEILRFTAKYFFQLAFGLFFTWVVGIPVTLIGVALCFIGACPAYILTHVSANDVLTQAYVRSLEEGFKPLNLSDDPPPRVG